MDTLVSYELADGVATITLDDGKVNVLSLPMQAAINAALDRAEADGAIVVLAGRTGVFSAGFDLNTLGAGGEDGVAMARGGFALAARLLDFPNPVVAACTGHAVAMGLFLVLSCDYRVGADGPFKLTANEVAIGLSLPESAIAILRHRVAPAVLSRAAILAEVFGPDNAVEAGILDQVVAPDDAIAEARRHARSLIALDRHAHATTKRRVRKSTVDAIHEELVAGDLVLKPTTAPA
jgi:enoyl-CoA hydratase